MERGSGRRMEWEVCGGIGEWMRQAGRGRVVRFLVNGWPVVSALHYIIALGH